MDINTSKTPTKLLQNLLRRIKPQAAEPTLAQLYSHICGHCGKKLSEHTITGGTTARWDKMKQYYDLNSCVIPKGFSVCSTPNGFGKLSNYSLRKNSSEGINRAFLDEQRS